MLALKETGYDSFVVGKNTEDFHNRIADIWAPYLEYQVRTRMTKVHVLHSDLQPIYKLIKLRRV